MWSKRYKVEFRKSNKNQDMYVAINKEDESDWFEIHDIIYTHNDDLIGFSITKYDKDEKINE